MNMKTKFVALAAATALAGLVGSAPSYAGEWASATAGSASGAAAGKVFYYGGGSKILYAEGAVLGGEFAHAEGTGKASAIAGRTSEARYKGNRRNSCTNGCAPVGAVSTQGEGSGYPSGPNSGGTSASASGFSAVSINGGSPIGGGEKNRKRRR